jgi:hypothetical protein
MTSLPERTAKKTLVASIVALHGNGCKQASYSVHVTIWTISYTVWRIKMQNIKKWSSYTSTRIVIAHERFANHFTVELWFRIRPDSTSCDTQKSILLPSPLANAAGVFHAWRNGKPLSRDSIPLVSPSLGRAVFPSRQYSSKPSALDRKEGSSRLFYPHTHPSRRLNTDNLNQR